MVLGVTYCVSRALFLTNARGNLFKWFHANNSTGPGCSLTHDGEFTGECIPENLKVLKMHVRHNI